MKVVSLVAVLVVLCVHFCTSKIVPSTSSDVVVEGELITPNSIATTENGRTFFEYIVKYGEITEREWFKPATLVTKSANDIRCANWHENQQPAGADIDYESFKDCLIVKIDTNSLNAKNPVIVYIPGFDLSSGDIHSTSGHYLLDKDVVLVTIQYRVGVLGFLSTNTVDIPGNAGIQDVILALKWIQKHISQFGGDPNRVTLSGQYKAAGLIGILTMSALAEGLFHQIIYQSGSPLLSNLTTSDPLDLTRKLGDQIGCKSIDDANDLTTCILGTKYSSLLEAYHNLMLKYDGDISPITIGGPSNVLPGEECPLERLENNKFQKYPILGGVVDHPTILLIDAYNEKEYSRFSMKYFKEEYRDKIEAAIPNAGEKLSDSQESFNQELTKAMVDFADSLVKGLATAFLPLEIDLGGLNIKTDLVKVLISNTEAGAPAYLYAFKYQGSEHYIPKKEGSWLKNYVTLLDDNVYLFKPEKVKTENDKQISKIIVELWTTFAETGKPKTTSGEELPAIVDASETSYFIIDKTPKIGKDYSKELTPLIDCETEKDCVWLEDSIIENLLIE